MTIWPFFAFVDARHPVRRPGTWRSSVTDRRIIGHELVGHADFGGMRGRLTAHER